MKTVEGIAIERDQLLATGDRGAGKEELLLWQVAVRLWFQVLR